MRAYLGVTDADWVRHLTAARADEANFWRPAGDRAFRALSIGEPFFFKTHHPDNKVVGGGFFSGFASLTISEAWQIYGDANGASTLEEMRARVGRYRRAPLAPHDDPKIGCVFIRDVSFFDEPAAPPPDFAPNVVQGKTYSFDDPSTAPYFDMLFPQLLGIAIELDTAEGWHRPGPAFGDPRLASTRLGQRAFQGVVRGVYSHRCAITGDKIRPVAAGRAHPTADSGWGASGRQRAPAPLRCAHAVRRGLPRRRAELQPGREPAATRGVWQRRGVLPARGIKRARCGSVAPARSAGPRVSRMASRRSLLAELTQTFCQARGAAANHIARRFVRPGHATSPPQALTFRSNATSTESGTPHCITQCLWITPCGGPGQVLRRSRQLRPEIASLAECQVGSSNGSGSAMTCHRRKPWSSCVVVGTRSTSCVATHSGRRVRGRLDNSPLFGISVFAVVDRPLDVLLRDRFTTFRRVHLTSVGTLRDSGFDLLPTGLAPHFTVRLDGAEDSELQQLLAALGPARDNNQYGI